MTCQRSVGTTVRADSPSARTCRSYALARGAPLSGADRPKQTLALTSGPGGEEQRVGRAISGGPVAELQRPETVNRDRLAVHSPEFAAVLVVPRGLQLISVDVPVAEVAARGELRAPRR